MNNYSSNRIASKFENREAYIFPSYIDFMIFINRILEQKNNNIETKIKDRISLNSNVPACRCCSYLKFSFKKSE